MSQYAEWHYAECRSGECRGAIKVVRLFFPVMAPFNPKGILNSFWTNNIGDVRFIILSVLHFQLQTKIILKKKIETPAISLFLF